MIAERCKVLYPLHGEQLDWQCARCGRSFLYGTSSPWWAALLPWCVHRYKEMPMQMHMSGVARMVPVWRAGKTVSERWPHDAIIRPYLSQVAYARTQGLRRPSFRDFLRKRRTRLRNLALG